MTEMPLWVIIILATITVAIVAFATLYIPDTPEEGVSLVPDILVVWPLVLGVLFIPIVTDSWLIRIAVAWAIMVTRIITRHIWWRRNDEITEEMNTHVLQLSDT